MARNQSNNNNREIVRRLAAFAIAAILFSTVGFFVLIWVFPAFSRTYSGQVNWDLLGGYVSLFSSAVLMGGFVFAFVEYIDREITKRRERAKLSYDIYQAIFEKLTAPEQEAARRWILSNIAAKKRDESIATWYAKTNAIIMARPTTGQVDDVSEGQKCVKLTLNCFDYIGFIANHYWDIDEDSLDWISPPIAKVWKRIGPYVTHIRTLRNAKDYYLSAEDIGKRCIEWRQKKGLPEEEYAKDTL